MKVEEIMEVMRIKKKRIQRVIKKMIEKGNVVKDKGKNDRRKRKIYKKKRGSKIKIEIEIKKQRRIEREMEE